MIVTKNSFVRTMIFSLVLSISAPIQADGFWSQFFGFVKEEKVLNYVFSGAVIFGFYKLLDKMISIPINFQQTTTSYASNPLRKPHYEDLPVQQKINNKTIALLILKNMRGDIKIISSKEAKEIEIITTKFAGNKTHFNLINVTNKQEKDTINCESHWNPTSIINAQINYLIKVPKEIAKKCDIEAHTTDGLIEIKGMRNVMASTNGNISLINNHGNIKAITTHPALNVITLENNKGTWFVQAQGESGIFISKGIGDGKIQGYDNQSIGATIVDCPGEITINNIKQSMAIRSPNVKHQ